MSRKLPEPRTPKLTQGERELLLVGLMRIPAVIRAAAGQLRDSHFSAEPEPAALWRATLASWNRDQQPPRKSVLLAALDSVRETSYVDMYAFDDAVGSSTTYREVVESAFNYLPAELDVGWTLDTLKRFLRERHLDLLQTQLGEEGVPAELPAMLQRYLAESRQIESLQDRAVNVPFPAHETFESVITVPTGVPFIDEFLGGGMGLGEVISLMGPVGSCKTTLSIQLCVEAARRAAARKVKAAELGKKVKQGVAYYFYYEGELPELRIRALACAGKIARTTLASLGSPFDLSKLSTRNDPESYKAYERQLFAEIFANIPNPPGELERYQSSIRALNAGLRLVDMSGKTDASRGRGRGGVSEMAAILDNEVRMNPDQEVSFVVLDYAGLMARRFVLAKGNWDSSMFRVMLTDVADQLGDLIAGPHKCPVLMVHQLKVALGKMSSGYVPHHTEGAECSSIAENAHFAFQVGVPDKENRVVINCSKHRRQPPREHLVVQIQGELARVVNVTNGYVRDAVTGLILPRSEVNRITPQTAESHGSFLV
jgi:hypothetical protein